jgi:hypothetical protein
VAVSNITMSPHNSQKVILNNDQNTIIHKHCYAPIFLNDGGHCDVTSQCKCPTYRIKLYTNMYLYTAPFTLVSSEDKVIETMKHKELYFNEDLHSGYSYLSHATIWQRVGKR